MRVLVTGGSGFIGSHVVDALLDAGHEPRIFDHARSRHHDPAEVDTRRGELLDLDELTAAVEGCDAVLHLAAMADVGEEAVDPVHAERVNAHGTLNVLQAARTAEVGRVVYASTIWVYGNGLPGGVMDADTPLGEPRHIYTATKLAGELYCRSYASLYGLETTILRFGIPYGPRARSAAVVPSFVRRALRGEPLTIAGDGRQSRRMVYVEDLAAGVVAGLAPVAANRPYTLVGGETVTVREIPATVRETVGDVDIVHGPARAGDFGGADVSGERAASELGWRAATPFAEGVRRYVAWLAADDAAEPVS
jgi:UDP-glucose 4-epimerase